MAVDKNKKTTIKLTNSESEETLDLTKRKRTTIKHTSLAEQKKSVKPSPESEAKVTESDSNTNSTNGAIDEDLIDELLPGLVDDEPLESEQKTDLNLDLEEKPLLNESTDKSGSKWHKLVNTLPSINLNKDSQKGNKTEPKEKIKIDNNPLHKEFWQHWNLNKGLITGGVSFVLLASLTVGGLEIFASEQYKLSTWLNRDKISEAKNYKLNQINGFGESLPEDDLPAPSSISKFIPAKYSRSGIPSRSWVEYTQYIFTEVKPAEPEAARSLAYVSSVYRDVFGVNKDYEAASEATRQMLNRLYPTYEIDSKSMLEHLSKKDSIQLKEGEQKILEDYLNREKNDKFKELKWDGKLPEGVGKFKKGSTDPVFPMAGQVSNWLVPVNQTFNLAEPIPANTAQYNVEIDLSKRATSSRTNEDFNAINFWNADSSTPAGVWQNKIYEIIKDSKPSDEDYSQTQSLVAQTIADSYTEAWKLKYTYWTERPTAANSEIKVITGDINSPSYVSAPAVVAETLRVVLSAKYPEKKELLQNLQTEVVTTELKGGLSFKQDINSGVELGRKLGKIILSQLKLSNNTPTAEVIGSKQIQASATDQSLDATKTSKDNGYLYIARSSSYPEVDPFVFTSQNDKMEANPGWTLEKVDEDPIWLTSNNPIKFEIVRQRYVVALVAKSSPFQPTMSDEKVIMYDLFTKKFYYIFDNTAEKLGYIQNLVRVGEEGIGITYYTPKDIVLTNEQGKPEFNTTVTNLKLINLPSLNSTDYRINFPKAMLDKTKKLFLQSYSQQLVLTGLGFNNKGQAEFYGLKYNGTIPDGDIFTYQDESKLPEILFPNSFSLASGYSTDKANEVSVYDSTKKVIGALKLEKGVSAKLYTSSTGSYVYAELSMSTFESPSTLNIGVFDVGTKEFYPILKNSASVITQDGKEYYKIQNELVPLGKF
ncbi:MAG: hypothetical protein OHK0017_07220 [Patescibacteria group bacterium]